LVEIGLRWVAHQGEIVIAKLLAFA
jgi:hypothetical protein